MKKQRHITFKVWLEIERLNEKTGHSDDMDPPGSSLATFDTYREAWELTMTQYIVHLYREMKLSYTGIEAETPEAAAAIAAGKFTDAADNIEDCEGQNLAALVDVAGDEDYSQSVTINFECERHRNAAPKLLAALESIVAYAENEAYSLEKLKDSPEAEAEAEKAWLAVEAAQVAIAQAKASGIAPADTDQEQANCRLIVAAPALLAACRMVVARWEHGDLAEAARACHAAVTLATEGRPPWDIPDTAPATGTPYSVLLLYPDYANDSGTEIFYAFVEARDPLEAVALAQRYAATAQEDIEIEPDDFMPLLVTPGHHASQPLFNK